MLQQIISGKEIVKTKNKHNFMALGGKQIRFLKYYAAENESNRRANSRRNANPNAVQIYHFIFTCVYVPA